MWRILATAAAFWQVLHVTEEPMIRVLLMAVISPERVTAMLPVLAELEIVQLTETSRLPTEPYATDTYPVRAKGFLIRVRAVWLT